LPEKQVNPEGFNVINPGADPGLGYQTFTTLQRVECRVFNRKKHLSYYLVGLLHCIHNSASSPYSNPAFIKETVMAMLVTA
jgi:hypothetical protein